MVLRKILQGGETRFKKKFKKKKKKIKKFFANLVYVANGESDDNEVNANLFTVSSSIGSFINFWILDSICSYHICLHRQWFETFKSCIIDIVLIGNDTRFKAIRIGTNTIKFRMFDRVIRI
jgi:hypothetical protein